MDTHLVGAPLVPLPDDDDTTLGDVVLDRNLGVLRHPDGRTVPLRPKTRAVLDVLVAHPGRVLGREALLDAVWPDVTVCDDSLTQAITEIRRALGRDRAGMIRTVPRRGYLFDPPPDDPTAPAAGPIDPAVARIGIAVRMPPTAAPPPAPEDHRPVAVVQAPDVATLPERLAPVPPRAARIAALAGTAAVALLAGWLATVPVAPPPAPAAVASEAPRATAERLHAEARALLFGPPPGNSNWLAQRELYLRAIATDPDFAPPYAPASLMYTNAILIGRSLNPAEDLRRAEDLAERALLLAPGDAVAHGARGTVLRLHGRLADALDAYREALARDPAYHAARANAGLMLLQLGRPAEALAPLRMSLALDRPDNPFQRGREFQLGLAKLHLGEGDFGAAEFRSASERGGPEYRDLRRLHLAAALALGGQVAEARDILAETLGRSPHLNVATLRAAALSDHPDYLAQREALFRGLALAGLGR